MHLTLHVWRQAGPNTAGRFERYETDAHEHMSFLEMLDVLNGQLIEQGKEPIAFEHDCREGICGSCGMVINARPHGPVQQVTACQLHMRSFRDGFLLARCGRKIAGSSEGFPIADMPSVAELDALEDPLDIFVADGLFYYLHVIQVLPGFRGRGIGDRLLERQIATARGRGATAMGGIALADRVGHWERRGFRGTGEWGSYRQCGRFQRMVLPLGAGPLRP